MPLNISFKSCLFHHLLSIRVLGGLGSYLGGGQGDLCDARKALLPNSGCLANLLCAALAVHSWEVGPKNTDHSGPLASIQMAAACRLL